MRSLEKLDPSRLVVEVENLVRSASVRVALDDDGEEGAEHDGRLEGVGPHDGLDSALPRNMIGNIFFLSIFSYALSLTAAV